MEPETQSSYQNIKVSSLVIVAQRQLKHQNIQELKQEPSLNRNKSLLFQNILAIPASKTGSSDRKPKEKDPEKTLELRNVSDLELYSQTNGTYKQHVSLDGVPSNPDTYFVKVKSSLFKDVYLPVVQ